MRFGEGERPVPKSGKERGVVLEGPEGCPSTFGLESFPVGQPGLSARS